VIANFCSFDPLAFVKVNLTAYIPDTLRSIFIRNALKMSIIKKGKTYSIELNRKERQQMNSILSLTGQTISKLINIPESLLQHVKISEVISSQLSNLYRTKLPEPLMRAFNRANVESKFIWNFLIALKTGTL